MDMHKVSSTAKGSNGNGCSHHWKIEEARGEYSWGKCCICHERRQFKNWIGADTYFGAHYEKVLKGNRIALQRFRGMPTCQSPRVVALELENIR